MKANAAPERIVLQPTTDVDTDVLADLKGVVAESSIDDVMAWWTLDVAEYAGLDPDGKKGLVVDYGDRYPDNGGEP